MGSDFISLLQLLFSTLWRFFFFNFSSCFFFHDPLQLLSTSSIRAIVITISFLLYKLLCRSLNEAGDVEAFVG